MLGLATGAILLVLISALISGIEQRAEARELMLAGVGHAPTLVNHLQRQTIERNYLSTLSEDSFIMHPSGDRNLGKSIDRAIKDLPEKSRIVFMLHRFEEFTYADIAESLGISIKTVEKRMSIALKILREKLAHWLHHD